jgi:hypothetical protein
MMQQQGGMQMGMQQQGGMQMGGGIAAALLSPVPYIWPSRPSSTIAFYKLVLSGLGLGFDRAR